MAQNPTGRVLDRPRAPTAGRDTHTAAGGAR